MAQMTIHGSRRTHCRAPSSLKSTWKRIPIRVPQRKRKSRRKRSQPLRRCHAKHRNVPAPRIRLSKVTMVRHPSIPPKKQKRPARRNPKRQRKQIRFTMSKKSSSTAARAEKPSSAFAGRAIVPIKIHGSQSRLFRATTWLRNTGPPTRRKESSQSSSIQMPSMMLKKLSATKSRKIRCVFEYF